MSRKISTFLCSLLVILSLVACQNTTTPHQDATTPVNTEKKSQESEQVQPDPETSTKEPSTASVLCLKGPTAMGLVKVMDQQAALGEKAQFNFSLSTRPDEVATQIMSRKIDLATAPANLASILYAKSQGDVQVLAINTLGVLYVVDRGASIHEVSDLRGKTLYASGLGATPEYALNYILAGNGLDPEKDVDIRWKSEHAECVQALAADSSALALLPQPFVTVAQSKIPDLRPALDLSEEWDKLQEGKDNPSHLIMGVLLGHKDFLKEHPELVQEFLAEYAESVSFVQDEVASAAELIEKFDIFPAKIAETALPHCHIVLMQGEEMQEALSNFLAVLAEQNPQAVGGKVPADDFYYQP